MGTNQALEAARALALAPSLAPAMQQARLPSDIGDLLRFLAGETNMSELTRADPSRLHDVVERYVFAVMLYPGASPERILGVPHGASREEMRAHMRLLMIWLHPDRTGDAWRTAHSARVLEAWRTLSAAPANARTHGRALPSRRARPRTRAIKLAWVARPVSPRGRTRRLSTWAGPALLACAVVAIAAFDNPLRRWVETSLYPPAVKAMKTEARPGP